jgi:hypothetical protein
VALIAARLAKTNDLKFQKLYEPIALTLTATRCLNGSESISKMRFQKLLSSLVTAGCLELISTVEHTDHYRLIAPLECVLPKMEAYLLGLLKQGEISITAQEWRHFYHG